MSSHSGRKWSSALSSPVAGLFLLGCATFWLAAARKTDESLSACLPPPKYPLAGVAYEVPIATAVEYVGNAVKNQEEISRNGETRQVAAELAEFLLPRSSGRYLVIIGSLGNPGRTFRIRLRCQPPLEANGASSSAGTATSSVTEISAGMRLPRGRPAMQPLSSLFPGKIVSFSERTAPATDPTAETVAGRQPFPAAQPVPQGRRVTDPSLPAFRTFYLPLRNGSPAGSLCSASLSARQIAAGSQVTVYLDRQIPPGKQTRRTAGEIVRLLEREIFPTAARLTGLHEDTDGDGRLTVLLTPRLKRLQQGTTQLSGLVRPADFYRDMTPPLSNRCDMLFLHSSLLPGPHLKAVLAHEYAHVVAFSHRAGKFPNGICREEDWVNEGLAHLCEELQQAGWSNRSERVRAFLNAPQMFPLVVPDASAAGLWRNPGCRGAAYLFFQWCADRFGRDVVRRLMRGEQTGTVNVEAATGCPFEDLFRHWTLAVGLSGEKEALPSDGRCGAVFPFRSIRLPARKTGRCFLSGPRRIHWHIGQPPPPLTVRGTAAAFLVLHTPPANAAAPVSEKRDPARRDPEKPLAEKPVRHSWCRVQISAEQGARLQVTLLKLPDETRPRTFPQRQSPSR